MAFLVLLVMLDLNLERVENVSPSVVMALYLEDNSVILEPLFRLDVLDVLLLQDTTALVNLRYVPIAEGEVEEEQDLLCLLLGHQMLTLTIFSSL